MGLPAVTSPAKSKFSDMSVEKYREMMGNDLEMSEIYHISFP